jgi:hypothetical protein
MKFDFESQGITTYTKFDMGKTTLILEHIEGFIKHYSLSPNDVEDIKANSYFGDIIINKIIEDYMHNLYNYLRKIKIKKLNKIQIKFR